MRRHLSRSGLSCCVLILMLALSLMPAFSHAAALRTMRFEHLGIDQGLPTQSVQTIAQDRQGNMWFGGQAGLIRFDGYRFTTYKNDPDDPRSLNSDWVREIYVDSRDRLWVATASSGLHLYDRRKNNFQRFLVTDQVPQVADKRNIYALVEDGKNGLWIATENGLKHIDASDGKIQVWHHEKNRPASLAHDRVNTLARDAQGNLWVGTEEGLDYLAQGEKEFIHFKIDSDPKADKKNNAVNDIFIDKQQNLWIGMRKGLLFWDHRKPWAQYERFALPEKLQEQSVKKILQDSGGSLWIAVNNSGVLRFDGNTRQVQHFKREDGDRNSLADDQVETLFQDRSGSLWIGYWTSGTSHVDLLGSAFKRYLQVPSEADSLSMSKVTGIVEAGNGKLLLGTFGGGLNLLDPVTGEASNVSANYGVSGKNVLGMFQARDRKLWIGTETALGYIDPVRNKFIARKPNPDEVATHQINGIFQDRAGILWAGNTRGLLRLDPASNELHNFRHSDQDDTSIAHDTVMAAEEDNQGRLWLATLGGIDLLDRQRMAFRHFQRSASDPASLLSDFVTTIFQDSKRVIWLGSSAGLSRMQETNDAQLKFKNYVTNAAVDCILEGAGGKLWLSTDAGIARFDPANGQMKYYTGKDGLVDGGYYTGSCLRDSKGQLYFGGLSGLSAFDPLDIHDNPVPPQVLITELQIFNQVVQAGKSVAGFTLQEQIQDARAITLSYAHSVFSLEFAAPHFADTERNQFAYQLQGFDKDWVYTDAKRRFATYTNLDPGEYVFRVKAANKDGVWNEEGSSLTITITPPYWKTWWFRIAGLLLIMLVFWGIYRYRLRQLIRQKLRLEQQVMRRTSEIAMHKSLVEQKTAELEQAVGVLAQANRQQLEHQSELTRFLAVASHDLRQPMHALNLYLQALSSEELSSASRNLLHKVQKCAGTMDAMFLSLLDLSRLDARVVEPDLVEFPLALILKKLELEFSLQAHAKGLGFSIGECQAWVNSDAGLLEQILRNLIANAIRYTPAGSVAINCREVEGRLRVAVSDTGIGISEHQQETVFEEFFQVGTLKKDGNKGMGLGLAIVKRLTDLLAIPITVQSELGYGTCFALSLQLAAIHEDSTSNNQADIEYSALLRNIAVVIVDDDETILHATQSLLTQWGCQVAAATSCAAALEKMKDATQIPDALICDYHLATNETGVEVIEKLRDFFNEEIPALLITGDTTVSSSLPQLLILHKPLQAAALHRSLLNLLQGNEGKQFT
ncbi:two-component regulator propeller domain-containing protein [Undibacterium sp. TJN19]|uniref:two-component regulator propeller domain-containing protein n=1 Tax=Undibacterium sp. TJN19 TaxID=3413055 RepID=UPI003BF3099C